MVIEEVITFALVYTVYTMTTDPKKWGVRDRGCGQLGPHAFACIQTTRTRQQQTQLVAKQRLRSIQNSPS
ncbi:hypothetical protein MUK42_09597 [Musa troglodytarum]|uniref:Uncharacterized protein n=1 Tax=Musa troglodytarum TaxID=320322 RepID=A0A9E7JFF6_9LILI|nr:hypothetical protein MUK42_09597 [Musa troglodytarum]